MIQTAEVEAMAENIRHLVRGWCKGSQRKSLESNFTGLFIGLMRIGTPAQVEAVKIVNAELEAGAFEVVE